MELIIEVQGRSRHSARHYRMDGAEVRIGRAYDNDVILDDPYVCPHHALLRASADGGLEVEDLDSRNGVYDGRHRRIAGRAPLASGDRLVLGQSQLRVHDRHQAVVPALPLRPLDTLLRRAGRPPVAVLLVLLMLAVFTGFDYLYTPGEFKLTSSFRSGLGGLLLACLWALLWVLVARLARHEGRFLQQLAVTLVFVSAVPPLTFLYQVLAYNLSAPVLEQVLFWLLWGAVLWWLMVGNLYAALVQTRARRRWTASLATVVVLAVAVTIDLDVDDFSPLPEYDGSIMPPALSWAQGETPQAFLDDAAAVFDVAAGGD